MNFDLKELPSGYLLFRASPEIWAQWPKWKDGPTREDCFHPTWSWPIIHDAWSLFVMDAHKETER